MECNGFGTDGEACPNNQLWMKQNVMNAGEVKSDKFSDCKVAITVTNGGAKTEECEVCRNYNCG